MIQFIFASALREFLFLVILPFIIWMISWWGYISGRLALRVDAFTYYWDSRFFLDNILRGVYPLWNAEYAGGVPWNFFLRRMGEFNPFYWIINGLKLLNVSPVHAHIIFLVFYYFIGVVGFWLIAKLFLKDRLTSTGAYLLLLFSWGAQIFCSFEVLLFVPLVWFFYFLFSFARDQKKHQFLGIGFTAALMITTYIPFFAITVIGASLFFFSLFFIKESFIFLKNSLKFISTHKFFATLSLGFFLLACVPAIDFYSESKKGGFVLPPRHVGSADSSEIAVGRISDTSTNSSASSRTVMDIITHGYFDKTFSNHPALRIGDFNMAYFFFIMLLLAIINPVSRRKTFLLLTGTFLALIAMTLAGRLYPFFLKHVFFFRYMRMMHFFLWLGVVPMAILLVMEQLRIFLQNHQNRKNAAILGFVIIIHVLFVIGLFTQKGVALSSYFAVGMSLIFFIFTLMGRGKEGLLAILLWISLIIQPIEWGHYIERNSLIFNQTYLTDHKSFYEGQFLLPSPLSVLPISEKNIKPGDLSQLSTSGYYENPWINNIKQFIDQNNIQKFTANKLLLFDNTLALDESAPGPFFAKLDTMWQTLQNTALLSKNESEPEDLRFEAPYVQKAQVIYEGSSAVKVLSFDSNTLCLQTLLDHPQFLLWTNGYHTGWHVYIDGREGRLLRGNYAFRGAWIPPGQHRVVFRFLSPLRYAEAYLLLGMFFIMLITLIVLGFKESFLFKKAVAHGQ
ncbi:MAG: hypothetical protein HQL26_05630 [Candidatus Omnitrophica bacterium]|nr:hypothetical protein [Candidatus Omnitrophota bacterium]